MRKLRLHNDDCGNGATPFIQKYAQKVLDEFTGEVIGVECGSAWGGNAQNIGTLWKNRGRYFAMDTFLGMPKHLAVSAEHHQAIRGGTYDIPNCMDEWYQRLGMDELSYEYQRAVLDENGLDNVILVKGEVDESSCDFIPYLNYAFLDMDLLVPMMKGYEAVKDKLIAGGYLLLHDVINNIPVLEVFYRSTILGIDEAMWTIAEEIPNSYLAVLKKNG